LAVAIKATNGPLVAWRAIFGSPRREGASRDDDQRRRVSQ
jgi:hypothetical protein